MLRPKSSFCIRERRWYSSPSFLTCVAFFGSIWICFNACSFLVISSTDFSGRSFKSFNVIADILNFSIDFSVLSMAFWILFHCVSSKTPLPFQLAASAFSFASFASACSRLFAGCENATRISSPAFLACAAIVFKPFCSASFLFRSSMSLFSWRNASLSSSISFRFCWRFSISCSNAPMVFGAYSLGSLPLPPPVAPDWAATIASNDADISFQASFIKSTETFCVIAKSFMADFILSIAESNLPAIIVVLSPTKSIKSLIDFSNSLESSLPTIRTSSFAAIS